MLLTLNKTQFSANAACLAEVSRRQVPQAKRAVNKFFDFRV